MKIVLGLVIAAAVSGAAQAAESVGDYVLKPGHASLQSWRLGEPQAPADNATTTERVELGKMLFFDPRMSGDGNMSCASCHNPMFGWSDGLPTARGFQSMILERATPTIVNAAYNHLQMWDGRKRSLEDQAMGPLEADVEMNMNVNAFVAWLQSNDDYRAAFAAAYPGEAISADTVSRAIAAFERTVVSNASPFDKWVEGDRRAMSADQVRGFAVFLDPEKGNCAVCHAAPNFTDDGFHNLGLASFGSDEPDLGRFHERPLGLMKGAFKTPTLRDVSLTAPYFHDGSAATLTEVIDHYERGGEVTSNLSPNMKPLALSARDKSDLLAFLSALTTEHRPFVLPTLPRSDGPVSWAAWDSRKADTKLANVLH